MTAVVVMAMNYEFPKRAFFSVAFHRIMYVCVSFDEVIEGSHIYQF